MRTLVFFFVSILLTSPAFAHLEDDGREHFKANTLVDIKVEEVNYAYAALKISFYLSEDHDSDWYWLSLRPDSTVTNRHNYYRIWQGYNDLTIYIDRRKTRDKAFTSRTIELVVQEKQWNKVFIQTHNVEINWPAPNFDNVKAAGVDTDSLDEIIIDRGMANHDVLYNSLIKSGYPQHKIFYRGSFSESSKNEDYYAVIGGLVDWKLAKDFLHHVFVNTDVRKAIFARTNELSKSANNIFLTYRGGVENPETRRWIIRNEELISGLSNPDLTKDQFYALVNLEKKTKEQTIQEMYEAAYRLVDNVQLRDAKAMLDKMIQIDPDFYGSYIELARYYMKRGEGGRRDSLIKAEKSLDIARELGPNEANVYVLLGYVYAHQGRYEEAHQQFVKAESLGTDNLWLYANWGENEYFQGNFSKAVEYYNRVYSGPKPVDRNQRVRNNAYSNYIESAIRSEKTEAVLPIFESLVVQYTATKNTGCLNHSYSELLLASGKYKLAEKFLKKSDHHHKQFPAYVNYGLWMHHKDEHPELSSSYKRRADIAASDTVQTILFFIQSEHLRGILKNLMEAGLNIDSVDKYNYTALLWTIRRGDVDFAKALLALGADPNFNDNPEKIPPLAFAVAFEQTEIVQLLIDAGADLNFVFADGTSLEDFAKSKGLDDIVHLLKPVRNI